MEQRDGLPDDVDPFPESDPAATVNEAAEQEWTATTTAFERIQTVLRRTTDWQSAREIADRARVSEPTARKHLTTLVDSTHASATDTGGTTRYRRHPDQHRFERIQELDDDHTRSELEQAIREMKTTIREFESTDDATSPAELVETLDPADADGWADCSRWKTTQRNLAFAKTALSFKETRIIDAMTTGEEGAATENA